MTTAQVLRSSLDESVNFVTRTQDGGALEARYVRRASEYFCCYISSQSGCNKGCQFCHLTASKQTMYAPATWNELKEQVHLVAGHYEKQPVKAQRCHINFMARGEALDNPYIDGHLLRELAAVMKAHGIQTTRMNISTIMPKTFTGDLAIRFAPMTPVIYYSLYSFNEEWRKKWMPGAMDSRDAMGKLAYYQRATGATIVIHGCFIRGQYDAHDFAKQLGRWKQLFDFQFNIVRYNPFSEEHGQEGDILEVAQYLRLFGVQARVVDRVGEDVAASCGVFVSA